MNVMKKIFNVFIISLLFTGACTEVCDHDVEGDGPVRVITIYDYFAGTWYEEAENEEIRFTKSGTMYDKYCNINRSGEIEGRYEVDIENKRMTYTYEFLGQMQFADWKLSDMTDISFTISMDMVGAHTLEKVVEIFTLNVGESCTLSFFDENPDYTLVSMETDSRIVSIDDNNEITAAGEKGTAYIRLNTDKGTAWAKVVVGDDCMDLWYDYVSFIGKDYKYMTSVLGAPSINGEDGYSFGYSMLLHDLITEVDFFMNTSTGLIEEIGLSLINAAPAAQIQSYMNSHYYPTSEIGTGDYYTTGPSLAKSIALVRYRKNDNVIRFFDASFYAFPDYSQELGKTQEEIVARYGELLYGHLPMYEVKNRYGSSVYFLISETLSTVTAVQFTLMPDHDIEEVHKILSSTYNYYKTDETNTKYAYRNAGEEDSTIMVIYDAEDAAVTWFDLENYGK